MNEHFQLAFEAGTLSSEIYPSSEMYHIGTQVVDRRFSKCSISYFIVQSVLVVFDFQSLVKALSDKEAEAHSEVDAFMEHCARGGRLEKALINSSVVD